MVRMGSQSNPIDLTKTRLNLLLFWGVTEFQDTYHGFLYFISFLFFVDSYFAGARETQEDTL